MAKDLKPIDVSDVPELLSIAQQVKETGQPCVLKHADEELAIITPVKQVRRARKTGIITKDDALFNIVGMAASDEEEPTDVSANKHKYLADAYASHAE